MSTNDEVIIRHCDMEKQESRLAGFYAACFSMLREGKRLRTFPGKVLLNMEQMDGQHSYH